MYCFFVVVFFSFSWSLCCCLARSSHHVVVFFPTVVVFHQLSRLAAVVVFRRYLSWSWFSSVPDGMSLTANGAVHLVSPPATVLCGASRLLLSVYIPILMQNIIYHPPPPCVCFSRRGTPRNCGTAVTATHLGRNNNTTENRCRW